MNAAARLVEVRVPDMGNFKDVAIIDVLVKPGETIEPEAPLVTLETEKATMDVPSTVGGVIEKIHVAKGGTVSPGDLVVTVRSEGAPGNDAATAAGTAPSQGVTGPAANNGNPPPAQGAATQGAQGQAAPGQGAAGQGAAGQGAAGQGATGQGATGQGAAGPGTQGPGAQGQPSTVQAGAAQGGPARSPSSQPTASSAPGSSSPGQASAGTGAAPSTPAKVATAAVANVAGAPASPSQGSAPRSPQGTSASSQGTAASGSAPSAQPGEPLRTDLPPINEPGFSRAHAGPSVRRFARELGVDLTLVKGGGFKGRVTHDDVKAFVKSYLAVKSAPPPPPAGAAPMRSATAPAAQPSGLPKVPAVDFAQFGPVETKPLTRIQRISGPRLHASWVNIPHVTQFDEADITDLEDLRTKLKQKAAEEGIKLTPLAFILRACVRALQEFPLFNTSLDATGANLVFKKYLNIGFAADTPNGLVVPVVRDANHKDVYEIARNLGELSEKARIGKVSAAEMSGGCFTISSLGGIGGTAFTPIINAPEVAILGVSRSALRPVYRDGAFVPRLLLPLSLSYDHRVIDGAVAARFTTFLGQTLADPRGLMEAVL
jgi:pyruvate dehydrogenase E2 component (dihydrolipoamide acetyltransferase)